MDFKLVKEVIDCMPKERTLFRYFKDRYAQILLYHFIENEMEVKELKKSRMAGLLQKPVMRDFLARTGSGKVNKQDVRDFWQLEMYHFVLTLDHWGGNTDRGWYQTTRKGHNLVLQLNFSRQHDGAYNKLVKPRYERLLNYYAHPVNRQGQTGYPRETLAWSRIDLDFNTNEALIEEIQSDWIRRAKSMLCDAKRYAHHGYNYIGWWDVQGHINNVVEYVEKVLEPYEKIWSEAMLAATVDFIRQELGIKTIYYHTGNTGYRVKKITYNRPPESLYSKLPRQFCFNKVYEAPEFLNLDKGFRRMYKRIKHPDWFQMEL